VPYSEIGERKEPKRERKSERENVEKRGSV
jgi:hypothetical protein